MRYPTSLHCGIRAQDKDRAMRRRPPRRDSAMPRHRFSRGFSPSIQDLEPRQLMAVGAPLNLSATPALNDRINLAWTDTATNEQGFTVERSTNGVNFTQIGTASANET